MHIQNIVNFFTKCKKKEVIQERLSEKQPLINDAGIYQVNNQQIDDRKLSSSFTNSVGTTGHSDHEDNKDKIKLSEEEKLKKSFEDFIKIDHKKEAEEAIKHFKSLINQ